MVTTGLLGPSDCWIYNRGQRSEDVLSFRQVLIPKGRETVFWYGLILKESDEILGLRTPKSPESDYFLIFETNSGHDVYPDLSSMFLPLRV